jgi:predicted RNA-binding protein
MTNYWLDLFTPETWEEAREHGFRTTGFRLRRKAVVSKIRPGDFFVCYLTKLSRFCGVLKAKSEPYNDPDKAAQIWKHDSFPCLIDVEPIVTFDFLHSIPSEEIVPKLSIAGKWRGIIRGSPVHIPSEDGELIKKTLAESREEYPIKTKTKPRQPKRGLKQEYGAPLEFKGLRHAPLNEQGVVYVFALVARDLGFTVEAIGTAFPDCEAKRQMDRKGERWQRVRIEFEYFSSDFRRHGHAQEGCDIIVCWKDDWPECPLEVIQLSEEIKKLGARFEQ